MEKCHAKQLSPTTFLGAIQNRWNQSAPARCVPVKQPFACSLERAPLSNTANVLLLSYYKASLHLVNFYSASSQDQGSNPESYPGPSLCHTLVNGASRPLSSLVWWLVLNWILKSGQPHRVSSTRPNSVISKYTLQHSSNQCQPFSQVKSTKSTHTQTQ